MLLCNPIRHIWLIKTLELILKRKMTPGTLCSLKALPRPPEHLRLVGPCWPHTKSTRTRLYGSRVADEETVGGRGRLAQDERGLAGPKGPQNFIRSGASMGPGGRPVPISGAWGEGQQKRPQRRTHHTCQGQLSSPGLHSAPSTSVPHSIGRQLRQRLPLLDPCLHCRLFTRSRAGGS